MGKIIKDIGFKLSHQPRIEIIVEKHGGTLKVNSSPGHGAQFLITIPIEKRI